MTARNQNEWNRIPTTDEAERDSTDNHSDSNQQEYVNDKDPALTEDDLRDNDLTIEEADNIVWDDDDGMDD